MSGLTTLTAIMASLPPATDRNARVELAISLLNGEHSLQAEIDSGFLLQFERLALNSLFLKDPVDDAPDLILRVSERLRTSSNDVAALMAAILLQPAFEWPSWGNIADIPEWLINAYATWRILSPRAFERPGQVNRYADYLHITLQDFMELYAKRSLGPNGTITLGNAIYNNWNLLPLYFTELSNLDVALSKSHLVERHLARHNISLSWVFPNRDPNEKIKVGFYNRHQNISPEGGFLLAHVEKFPRERCELILFYQKDIPNPFQDLCHSFFDQVILLTENQAESVTTIRAQNLDILAFANNATAVANHMNLYCSSRLAKTQVVLAASPMSTGYTASDIFLTAALNEVASPIRDRYCEEIYTMPGMTNYFALHHDHDQQTMTFTRQSLGVPEYAVIFMSFANYYKCIPELVESWVRILQAVADSVLVLLPFGIAWGLYDLRPFINNLTARFHETGISTDRLVLVAPLPVRADVIALARLADVYLDSYPFSGSCSLIDPLLVHVPVVAHEGSMFRNRFAATMLRFVGLSDLITDSNDAYEAAAVRLANSPSERKAISERIKRAFANGVPYFDMDTMATRVEQAFVNLSNAYEARRHSLRQMPIIELKKDIATLTRSLSEQGNPMWEEFHSLEWIRLLAMALQPITNPQALHFDLSPLLTNHLESQDWVVTAMKDFSGLKNIDLAYFKIPHDEYFSIEFLKPLKPSLIILDIKRVHGAETYWSKMTNMQENGYDFMILTFKTDARVPFLELDNFPTGIYFEVPDEPSDCAFIVFFPINDRILLATLLETFDRFRHGRDRSWMRLVPEGQREQVIPGEA